MTDREILSLYRNGQQEKAFRAIVDSYSERLYWIVRHFLCSHEDTDDVLQDIFLKIWNTLPTFRGDARLYTWMYRIACNESLNFLAKKKVRAALMSGALSLDAARNEQGPDPYFDGDEAQRKLIRAITLLPDKQRLVFTMRYFDDLSYEEISRILGTSVGALKASYHFAVEKIKQFFENQNIN